MITKAGDGPGADLRGAAFHEAGHVVVAVHFGLPVREIEIGMNGDDASGRAEIGCADGLSFVNQLALCAAGTAAQAIFNAPTHDLAERDDMAKMVTLLADLPERESFALRQAAYARAREILEANKAAVEEVALRLMRERLVRDP
jgi:hypothetical protein